MRNLVVLSVAAVVALTTSPASADELMQRAQETFKPIPSVVPAVKGNAVTRDKIELGKMLFFAETPRSGDSTQGDRLPREPAKNP